MIQCIIVLILLFLTSLIFCNDNINSKLDAVFIVHETKYYIIKNGYYYSIDDRYAIKIITSDPVTLPNKHILEKKFRNGGKFPYFKNNNVSNMDHLDIVNDVIDFIRDNSNDNDKLLYDISRINLLGQDVVYNGAIIPVDNVYLGIDRTSFFWLNEKFLYDRKLNSERQKLLYPSSEQDYRLLMLSNKDILMVFTAMIAPSYIYHHKIGIRYMYKDKVVNGVTLYKNITDRVILLTVNDTKEITEKNWTPFNYENKVFFISKFDPFHVVQIDKTKSNKPIKLSIDRNIVIDTYNMTTVSKVYCPTFHWIYGGMRGGTPALLVRGQYLSFYHTKSRLINIFRDLNMNARLYFNGAFTFSSTIPFKVTGFTKYPIIHKSFRPYKDERYDINYVVYVMSYLLVDKDNKVILENEKEEDPETTEIVITIGLNDKDTVIARMNLNKLLSGLTKVSCDVLEYNDN